MCLDIFSRPWAPGLAYYIGPHLSAKVCAIGIKSILKWSLVVVHNSNQRFYCLGGLPSLYSSVLFESLLFFVSTFSMAANSIVGISNNFTIGFGSFVDKVLVPYINLSPEYLSNPCANRQSTQCVPIYSYKHVVSLTPNQTFFNVRDWLIKTVH